MNKADLFYKPLIKEAWGLTKKYYWIIFLYGLINIIVSVGFSMSSEENFIVALLSIFVSVIFKFWSQRLSIMVAKGQDLKFGDIFEGFNNFGKYFITSLVYGLIVLGGFILLIVPGIVWSLKYFLAPYFALDKGMSYKDALKASAKATDGLKLKVLALGFILFGLIIVSMIPFFLGLLITIPLCFVISVLLYVHLSKTEEVVDSIAEQPVEIPAEVSEPVNVV